MNTSIGDETPATTGHNTHIHDQWEDFIKKPLTEMSALMTHLERIYQHATKAELHAVYEQLLSVSRTFRDYVQEPHPEEADNLVMELHANINHQIGNLLMAGQAISRTNTDSSRRPKMQGTITNILQRIDYLLLTDFNFARHNFAQAREYNETPEVWCHEVLQKLSAYKKAGFTCEVEAFDIAPEAPLRVHTHPGIIALALQELILNAEKSYKIHDIGPIRLTVKRAEGVILFSVTDQGRGMTEKEHQTMFHKGVSQTNSTGMGLWQVKYLAEAFDVDIYCAQTVLGQGTTMTVVVPLFTEEE